MSNLSEYLLREQLTREIMLKEQALTELSELKEKYGLLKKEKFAKFAFKNIVSLIKRVK